ncbi:hypothetical protein PV04_04960 [Phialophora macrospora]|uniref:Uncharacterized protein n=1 Tax=Phialophora macrospora TaxID=1851006 RepID=A0A0D2CVA5_9EURO|nr:hypothetical protein PV04_04960 [Phialophora macrospora]
MDEEPSLKRITALSAEIDLELYNRILRWERHALLGRDSVPSHSRDMEKHGYHTDGNVCSATSHVLVLVAERLSCPRPETMDEAHFREQLVMDNARSISADGHHFTVLQRLCPTDRVGRRTRKKRQICC